MLLHLSVSHSVHKGSGIPACIAGGIPACLAGLQGGIPACLTGLSRPTPKGEVKCQWGVWPGGSPGPHPGGKLRGLAWGSIGPHLQAHTQGGRGVSRPDTPPADGYCCGQYTSDWNAFLFSITFVKNCMKKKKNWTARSANAKWRINRKQMKNQSLK